MSDCSEQYDLSPEWVARLRLIPGYDPFAQAEGCWFDTAVAELAINFIEGYLVHVEGDLTGKPFALQEWQKCIVANLFGWKRKDDQGRNVRRFREAFIEIPRKNGKTPLAAAIALTELFLNPEEGQQNFLAAGDREQASLCFRHARGMVERNAKLMQRAQIYGGNAAGGQSKSIILPKRGGSFLRVISADANTKHGGNTNLAIVDELHVQPDRDLVDVLQTSMASANRRNPMLVHITTAGHNRQSICYEKYEYACKVRDNGGDKDKPGYDPAFLPVIYEAAANADWTSEDTWRAANPNLGVSVSIEYLRRECKRAQEIPDYENTFRQLHLNQWTEQASRWLSMRSWDACKEPFAESDLLGVPCYGGLDLATIDDIAAFVLVARHDGQYWLVPRFWCSSAKIERRSMAGVPYRRWRDAGLLTVCGGDTIDYTQIRDDINGLRDAGWMIKEIAFDPAQASMLAKQLEADGFELVRFAQTHTFFNEPCKIFETAVIEGTMRHGGHPVLRWMAANVALDHKRINAKQGNSVEQSQLRMPSKAKSGEKIDGIVAALMGLGRAILVEDGVPSVFF